MWDSDTLGPQVLSSLSECASRLPSHPSSSLLMIVSGNSACPQRKCLPAIHWVCRALMSEQALSSLDGAARTHTAWTAVWVFALEPGGVGVLKHAHAWILIQRHSRHTMLRHAILAPKRSCCFEQVEQHSNCKANRRTCKHGYILGIPSGLLNASERFTSAHVSMFRCCTSPHRPTAAAHVSTSA